MQTYTTVSGDTWDSIAYEVYGSEIKAGYLMENNPKIIDVFVFGAGTEVIVPELPVTASSNAPAWRT